MTMDDFQFFSDAYNLKTVGVFAVFALLDVALKGWAMWRAARMQKLHWFIGLLMINSMGILPVIFILLTKEEYQKLPKGTPRGK